MKACPKGWHLPSKDEWQKLVDFAGGDETAGNKLKAKNGWNGRDVYGFSALPGGYYIYGSFDGVGNFGYWWSASKLSDWTVYNRSMTSIGSTRWGDMHDSNMDNRYSVRCVKDN
jgi:uncharacterized protein (TIGR02145 family)